MQMRKFLAKIAEKISPPKPISYSETSKEKDILRDFDVSKKDLMLIFKSTPIVNRFIRYRADLIISRGYHFEFSDKESEAIINRFLSNIKKNDVPFHREFDTFLRDICIDCDWSGNGYFQLVPNKNNDKIVKLHKLHPIDVDFIRDTQNKITLDSLGDPTGYSVAAGIALEGKELKIKEVVHLVFETVGDELLGIPLILPAFRTVERLVNIDWAMAQALYKHGLPTRSISVGDPNHEPTADDIKQVAEDVKGLDSAAEYTHPYFQEITTIDPKWPARVEEVPNYFMSKLIAISGIPHHILLGEETIGTKATAESLQQGLGILLEPLQQKIKAMVEEQIFRVVLDLEGSDAEIKMVWKSSVPRQVMPYADKVFTLSQTILEGKHILSWKDARDLLQMPSDPEVQEGFISAPPPEIQAEKKSANSKGGE